MTGPFEIRYSLRYSDCEAGSRSLGSGIFVEHTLSRIVLTKSEILREASKDRQSTAGRAGNE